MDNARKKNQPPGSSPFPLIRLAFLPSGKHGTTIIFQNKGRLALVLIVGTCNPRQGTVYGTLPRPAAPFGPLTSIGNRTSHDPDSGKHTAMSDRSPSQSWRQQLLLLLLLLLLSVGQSC